MLAQIRGQVLEAHSGSLVIDVAGLGIQVFTPDYLALRYEKGEPCQLYTSMQFRSEVFALYGFSSIAQRELFEHLLGVSGVGPKVAIKVFEQLSVQEVLQAIASEDYVPFTQVSGVGKKTAQRLLIELAGKVQMPKEEHLSSSQEMPSPLLQIPAKVLGEAKETLMALGCSDKESQDLIKQIQQSDLEIHSASELVVEALALLEPPTS